MRFHDEERKRLISPSRVAGLMGVMLLWGLVAAPSSVGVEEEIIEPTDLVAYSTNGDARPVQVWFDHQAYQIPLGPSLARSQTEVAMPSAASGLAWLVDAGLANGLHGTTTGNRVPTEASAKQPGSTTGEEFRVAGGPVGDDDFIRVGAGVAGARAERDDTPRGYGYSHFDNLMVLPAPGAEPNPPGTFNPDTTFPGGEDLSPEQDPQPTGQMAVVSVGSIASTSESFRNGSTVTSVSVAELSDVNIGNRTSDNRCTNCIRIDSIRAEAFAEATGQPGGSRGRYRVVLGRACRRALTITQVGDDVDQREVDQCIQPAPTANALPEDTRTPTIGGPPHETEELEHVKGFNDFFAERMWSQVPGLENVFIGIKVNAGEPHSDPDRAQRGGNPPEATRRNYGYPDQRLNREDREDPRQERKYEDKPIPRAKQQEPDRDKGTRASAVAEALDIEITTITLNKLVPSDDQLDDVTEDFASDVDEDPKQPGIQISVPGCVVTPDETDEDVCPPAVGTQVAGQQVQVWPVGGVSIGTEAVRTIRRMNLSLGVAQTSTTVRPSIIVTPPAEGDDADGTGGPTTPPVGGTAPPPVDIPGGTTPPATQPGEPGTVVINGGLKGPLKIRFNWSAFRLKPWAPGDQAKGFLSGGILGGAWILAKRRLRLLS